MVIVLAALLATTVSLGGTARATLARAAPAGAHRRDALRAPERHVRGLGDMAADLLAHGARRSYTFARLLDSHSSAAT